MKCVFGRKLYFGFFGIELGSSVAKVFLAMVHGSGSVSLSLNYEGMGSC